MNILDQTKIMSKIFYMPQAVFFLIIKKKLSVFLGKKKKKKENPILSVLKQKILD